jgi:serine/threonine protein kinase
VSQFVGSLAYMAPERLRGQDLPASDLFALGVTLYEAIEGISPFARATPIAVMSAIAMEQPAPPLHAAHLSTLVLSLLEKDPAQRPDARSTLERLSGRIPPNHAGTVHSAPTATNWTRSSPPASSHPPVPEPGLSAPRSRRRGFTTLKWTAAVAAASLASILIYTRLAPGDPRGNGSSAGNGSATQSPSAQAEDGSSRGNGSPSPSTQATSSGGSGLPGSYAGTWTGTATQDNFGQVQGDVDVEVDLTGGALGQQVGTLSVSYLTIYTCTFSLILTSAASDGPEVFDAREAGGVCTAPVTVTLQQTSANSLSYNTKAANAAQTAESGTLTGS